MNYVGLCRGMFFCRIDASQFDWFRPCTSSRAAAIIAFVANEIG